MYMHHYAHDPVNALFVNGSIICELLFSDDGNFTGTKCMQNSLSHYYPLQPNARLVHKLLLL